MADQRAAVEAYVQALRTGEAAAAQRAAGYLAPDVVLNTGREEFAGHDAVLARISGQWPLTPVYQHGGWSEPHPDGDGLSVQAEFGPFGAAPRSVSLRFAFNAAGQISRVEQRTVQAPPPETSRTLPDFVRGLVNGALANGTPLTLAYVDAEGRPVQSLRGSTHVFSDHQLAIWLRNPNSGMAQAMQRNPALSLLYRDSKTRTTLIFQGRGHVEADPAVRERVFALSPEVEQNHDPERHGLALIIDVERVQGASPRGSVRMERPAP
ncbi:MAG TPA: pyridoxamine 5'-phosphate oxidase family protein [Dehalococcoidia bacterium]|nr:pyridoxamine 5'-phosphate oxidase family protein [Dehalococcoidia bacterium]